MSGYPGWRDCDLSALGAAAHETGQKSARPRKVSSGLEADLAEQIRLLGLPAPEREVRLIPGRRWRWDFVWRVQRLCVEVQGGTWSQGAHSRGAGQARDAEKQAAATLGGYRCLSEGFDLSRRWNGDKRDPHTISSFWAAPTFGAHGELAEHPLARGARLHGQGQLGVTSLLTGRRPRAGAHLPAGPATPPMWLEAWKVSGPGGTWPQCGCGCGRLLHEPRARCYAGTLYRQGHNGRKAMRTAVQGC